MFNNLLAFIRSHGNKAWIEGDRIAIEIHYTYRHNGVAGSGIEIEYIRTEREALNALGY